MEKNKNECKHDNLTKEYINGMSTGDYKCLDCGAVGWGRQWPENERDHKEKE